MMHKKLTGVILLLIIVVTLITTYVCNKIIINSAKGKLYINTKTIPFNKVGLLPGTSKFVSNNRVNPFYSGILVGKLVWTLAQE